MNEGPDRTFPKPEAKIPKKFTIPDDYIGMYSGQYQLLNIIGKSNQSYVYSAKNVEKDVILACKIVLKSKIDTTVKKQLIDNEILIHSNIFHNSIVQSYFVTEDNNNYYIFMDYCNGGTLYDKVMSQTYKYIDIKTASKYI